MKKVCGWMSEPLCVKPHLLNGACGDQVQHEREGLLAHLQVRAGENSQDVHHQVLRMGEWGNWNRECGME